jgi:hypothetical protein
MTDLERTNAERRAALIVAGKQIVKLNFGKKDDTVLRILRRALRESRAVARVQCPTIDAVSRGALQLY